MLRALLRSLFVCCVVPALLHPQVNTVLRSVRPLSAEERRPVRLSVELRPSVPLVRVVLHYRAFGASEYRAVEMPVGRDSASVEIPAADVQAPFVEYYISALDQNGGTETFPSENPEVNPARLMVTAAEASELIVLSPEEGERITEGETYISVSFVFADERTDKGRTTVMLNGVDLSGSAVLFDDLLIVPPEAIPPGLLSGGANLEVRSFDASGSPLSSVTRGFQVVTEEEAEEIRESFRAFGNAQAETRRENIKGTAKTYNRLDVRAQAVYLDFLKAQTNLTVTSEERPENQPQNRYYVGLDARYVRLGLGDAYPRFPYTMMDGRRIRGYTADLLLGAFNLNVAGGEVLRRVESNGAVQTLKREMTVVRPSFGAGERFQWGFTYLKSKDAFDANQPLTVRPQENVVFGTDLMVGFDNRRIELTAQSALSMNNVDISVTEFNEDSIDAAVARGTLSASEGADLKRIMPFARPFLTVNENLAPLDPRGLTSLVYETALAFNYFGNYLKASYLFHGKDYTSFGATTIRRDIRGFNVSDRLRLLDNRLFLSASYERLANNTSGTEIATTTYTTVNSSVSYYPARSWPNVTVGYGLNRNSNPIDPLDTAGVAAQIALRAIDDRTNRWYLQTSYDFSYWGRHNLTLNIDVSSKDDRTPKQQDVSTLNTVLLVNTAHTDRLESTAGLSLSSLSFPQADSLGAVTEGSMAYQTVTLSARYLLYRDILRLTATAAPTFGDLGRLLLESSLQYQITEHQTAVLQAQFIRNTSSALASLTSRNDSFVSLLYRIDF